MFLVQQQAVMLKTVLTVTLLTGTAGMATTDACARPAARVLHIRHASRFLSVLDRDGDLSAGWIDVLPVLATACKLRLDNQELTSQLVDLSREDGNVSYTRDLYTTLQLIESHRTKNSFVAAWTARFDGRQKEACDTAEALWGEAGHQFPGILKHEASSDGAGGSQPGTAPNTCK